MTDVTNSPDLDVSRSAEAGDMLLHVDKECYAQICTCEEKQNINVSYHYEWRSNKDLEERLCFR